MAPDTINQENNERPKGVTDEHLEYLDDLRETAKVNMFCAATNVKDTFGIDIKDARIIHKYWMKTFGDSTR